MFFRFAVTLKSLKSNIFLKYMIIYIRFTTKDTRSKYITCTLVESKLPVLKPYIVGEPKSRILLNDRKIAPERPTAEFLYTGSQNSA